MSRTMSPATGKVYGLKRVCRSWNIARATLYRKKAQDSEEKITRRGPKPLIEEEQLLSKIRKDIENSPFKGEGHRKVHARLKREGIKVGRNRVLKVMRNNNLLSPHRSLYRPANPRNKSADSGGGVGLDL